LRRDSVPGENPAAGRTAIARWRGIGFPLAPVSPTLAIFTPIGQPRMESRMNARRLILAFVLLLATGGLACAADLTGKWASEFDSQIGPQKYAFDFQVVDGQLTGKAKFSHSMGSGENVLTAIKVAGDEVSFTEVLRFDGMEIVVTYKGKFVGAEVHLTRTVGEFAVEEIVLKRSPETPPAA
jgi:hypothetical protein